MKPFERDHHAAQLSVGFHAKPANLTCIVSLEQPATRSTLGRRRGSPCMTACITGERLRVLPQRLRGSEELCTQ